MILFYLDLISFPFCSEILILPFLLGSMVAGTAMYNVAIQAQSDWILLQGYNSNSLFLSFNETGPNFMLILWVMYKMQDWMKSLRRMVGNHDPYLLIGSILRSSFSFLFPNFIFPYGSTINCCWLVNSPMTFAEHKSHLEIPKCIPPVKDSEHQVCTDGSFLLP